MISFNWIIVMPIHFASIIDCNIFDVNPSDTTV